MKYILYFIAVLYSSTVLANLTVNTDKGKIQGYLRTSPNKVSFATFQGIPYAKPPLGNLRFQAPVPHDPWSGVLETKKDGNRCYTVAKDTPDESEDCLFINVFTPVLNGSTDANLPVMVFIFGGGFRDGASQYNVYGPDYLVETGVVVVTLNYRVGPFGFLATGDSVVPGNAGLKDQLLGLQWVQKNIKNFGGDPSKVTIFGQSAGAASVGLHILSKRSAGLFRGAISESGCAISSFAYLPDPIRYAKDLVSMINSSISVSSNEDLLQFLVNVPAKDIDVASTKTTVVDHPLPVIEPESETAFLTKSFYETLKNGDINKVPLLIGFNSEEYISLAADMASLKKRAKSYDDNPKKLVYNSLNIHDKKKQQEVGLKIKNIYLKPNETFEDNLGLAVAYNSEFHFINPVVRHAELQSQYTDVYLYKFSHAGPLGKNYNITLPGAEKCTHSEELFYIFKRKMQEYDNSDLSKFPESDVLTHKRFIKFWTNFAKHLNPTPEKDADLQNITWPKVSTDDFKYLNIDTDLTLESDVKHGRYNKWKSLIETEAVAPIVVV